MKKRRIILHIGTHKTGTTTLQNTLYQNRSNLLEQGYCYPTSSLDGAVRTKQQSLWVSLGKGDQFFSDYWNGVLAEWDESGADALIMSEEGLGIQASRAPNATEKLRKIARGFEVEAICYLRRPDTFAESFWNQSCKNGSTKFHIGKFVDQEKISRYLDYGKFLDTWRTFSKVHAVGFETACSNGLMDNFSSLTGIKLIQETIQQNSSPSMTCAAMLAALSRRTGELYNWRKVERLLGEDKRWTALGRRRRIRLLERFSEQRERLFRDYGVVFPDTLPDEPEDMIKRPVAKDVARFAQPELLRGPRWKKSKS